MSPLGYELPWMGIVEAEPSPHELHALIIPCEFLHMTRRRTQRRGKRGGIAHTKFHV